MGLTDRVSESFGGPRGGTCWFDSGDGFTLQNHTAISAGTSATNLPQQTVTRPNAFYTSESSMLPVYDVLDSRALIQTLYGFQMTPSAVLAATANLGIFMSVFRQIGSPGVSIPATAITSITLAAPGLTQSLPSGQVIVFTNPAGNTFAATLSAAASAGATVLAVNSVTPGNVYGTSSVAVIQVGNGPAFGWLPTGGGTAILTGLPVTASGTGTPLMAFGTSVFSPPITANSALVTGGATGAVGQVGLPMQSGDSIILTLQTNSGSQSVSPANIQPIMT